MRGLVSFLPLILLVVAMYFVLFRPQQRRMAEHQRLVRNIDVGDEIVTSSGIFGKITRLTDDRVEIEVSGGSRMEMLRNAIAQRVGDDAMEVESSDSGKSLEAKSDEDDSLE